MEKLKVRNRSRVLGVQIVKKNDLSELVLSKIPDDFHTNGTTAIKRGYEEKHICLKVKQLRKINIGDAQLTV